jgi:hypothetical protein
MQRRADFPPGQNILEVEQLGRVLVEQRRLR